MSLGGSVKASFTCHSCGNTFDTDVENQWGMYEFVRCPDCGSAKTTLAATASKINASH